jgi:hypothetical protein
MPQVLTNETWLRYLAELVEKSESQLSVGLQDDFSDDPIPKINAAYKRDNLALILGAGVSKDFGLMSWGELLQNLFINAISHSDKNSVSSAELSRCFNEVFAPSPLIAARYLMNNSFSGTVDAEVEFSSRVRDVLYRNLKGGVKSKTMNEIVRLSLAVGKNCHDLHSIITYNFDDLLEIALSTTKTGVPFKSIYKPGVHPGDNELAIYHVHGYLPQKGTLTSDNRIVFSESYYHEQYSQVYHWSNLVQINTFSRASCLFIGSSLSDPNQRRLLDIAKNIRGDDQVHHHIIKIKHSSDVVAKRLAAVQPQSGSAKNAGTRVKRPTTTDPVQLAKLMDNFEEKDALSFGVGTIWVDSAAEIGDVLSKLKA